MQRFHLSPHQRQELLQEHRLERNKRYADRIKAILLIDKGWTYFQIAEALLLDESTIRRHQKAYEVGGLDGLIEDDYAGGVTKFTSAQEKEFKLHLEQNIYLSTLEVIDYTWKKFKIRFTRTGMRDLLHRLGFTYKKPKVVPGKANGSDQEDFLEKYEILKENLGKNEVIYFADTTHPQHNSMPSYGWILRGETVELKTNAARQRLNLQGAVDIQRMDVIVNESDKINADSMISFLKKIENKNPESKKIYVIVDNASYHRAKNVKEYLNVSRVRLVFLPPYSPNLNLIERLWKFFHKKVLYNQYYPQFIEFKESCLNFFKKIKNYQEDLKNLLTENFEMIGSY